MRQVPVVPAVDGKPAPGYLVGKTAADPPTVEVVGPESAIERVTEALTEPFSVAGARERVRETVTVGLLDTAQRLKSPGEAVVPGQELPGLELTARTRTECLTLQASD